VVFTRIGRDGSKGVAKAAAATAAAGWSAVHGPLLDQRYFAFKNTRCSEIPSQTNPVMKYLYF
jgi:hypothetical protein